MWVLLLVCRWVSFFSLTILSCLLLGVGQLLILVPVLLVLCVVDIIGVRRNLCLIGPAVKRLLLKLLLSVVVLLPVYFVVIALILSLEVELLLSRPRCAASLSTFV